MIRSGPLDRRMQLFERNVARDGYGGEVVTYDPVRWIWADVQPLAAGEVRRGDMVLETRRIEARVRYAADITTAHRLAWDGVNWNILDLAEIGLREGLALTMEVIQ